MRQLGFFDVANHYGGSDAKNVLLLRTSTAIWKIGAIWLRAGRSSTLPSSPFPPSTTSHWANGKNKATKPAQEFVPVWSISSVHSDMGETLVHSIGLTRAKARISLKNLAYNMRRLVLLKRLATAASPWMMRD